MGQFEPQLSWRQTKPGLIPAKGGGFCRGWAGAGWSTGVWTRGEEETKEHLVEGRESDLAADGGGSNATLESSLC